MTPFEDRIVIEIAEGVAGPACGLQCVDLGARVIKIEGPDGDRSREWGPPLASGDAAIFAHLNGGKESVVLDLGQETDRERLETVLAAADAVIVQEDPALPSGIAWGEAARRHPNLLVVEIDELGATGPLAGRAGSELVVQAMSGFTRYVGEPGGEPCRVGFEIAGMATAMHAFQALAAGLLARERGGQGQHVRLSSLGSLLSMKTILFAAQSGATDDWTGFHLNGPHWPADTGWDTADGQVTFDFRHGQRDAWLAFCRSIGLERLGSDPDYEDWRSTIYIGDRRFEFGTPYREVFARMSSEAVSAAINRHGGISVKFHDYAELLAHPQVAFLAPLVASPEAAEGARSQVGTPFRFDGVQVKDDRAPAPRLGAHTDAVLREFAAERPRARAAGA